MGAEQTLREVFGLERFRGGQADVVQAQLEGRDVLSVAPTGSGKSISYWVPALVQGGLTIVVSPLIALMKDQVDRLQGAGVQATFVNSSIDRQIQWQRLMAAKAGDLRLLYLAPERFSRPGFVGVLADLPITRFVIDEAHCISTWGHDFRPDYRLIGRAVETCGRPPISAFTATATPDVRRDIVQSLELRDPFVSVTGFHRANLLLEARRCRNDDEKRRVLRERLASDTGRALVYCATVRSTEELAAELRQSGVSATAYHAQLEEGLRRRTQEDFATGKVRVVVATIAFGMGVDIPDIRHVIHYHLPSSLEGYYQEAGRAGRDGEKARCLLLWRPGDRDIHSFLIERTFEQVEGDPQAEQRRAHAYAKLQLIQAYAGLRTCRHARIADYFGEEGVARTCRECDNCLDGSRPAEVAVETSKVRAALSAIGRHNDRLGASNLAAILSGADTRWIRERPWAAQKPVYGALDGWKQDRVRALLSELVEAGLSRPSPGEYPTLQLTRDGQDVLQGRREVEITLPAEAPSAPARSNGANGTASAGGPLFERLRRWRSGRAQELGVPAYVVLTDRTLSELATRRPATNDALLDIPGIGPNKLERFGSELLAVLAEAE